MAETMTPKTEAVAVAAKTTYASDDLQPLNLQARDFGDLDLLPAVPQPLAQDEQLGQSENLGVQANGANPYWPPTSLGLVAGFKGTPIPAGPPPTLGKLPSGLEDTYRLRLDAKPYALDLGEDAPWKALGKNADIAVMNLQYALRGGIDPGVTSGFTPPPELRDARAWAASFPDGGFDLTDITRYREYALRTIVGDENFNNYARWLTTPTPDRTKPAIMDFENRTLSPGGYTTPLDGIQGTLTLANNVLFAMGSAWANQATTYGGSQDRFALGAGVITREQWTLGDVAPNTVELSPRVDLTDAFKVKPFKNGTFELKYRYPETHGLAAYVDKDGILGLEIKAGGDVSRFGSGKDMFYSMMQRIEAENIQINGIRGMWLPGENSTNYNLYRSATSSGLTPEQAATRTWTGQRAAEYGFTQVQKVQDTGKIVRAWYVKPNGK